MQRTDIVIVAATRTAIGRLNGSLATLAAHQMTQPLLEMVLKNTGVDASDVSEIIMGQVLGAGAGQNPARQASLHAGIPHHVPAWTVNHVCGSGLKAIMLGMQSIILGNAKVVIAGGHESMSQAPHLLRLRNKSYKMGNVQLEDSMVADGLTDAFYSYHMGITAENLAKQYNISRQEQDEFALLSQQKAEAAQQSGRFKDEITPLSIKAGNQEMVFVEDEYIRLGAKIEDLQKLRPAFTQDGTVTAGNASGVNDGAAVVMLMTLQHADNLGLKPLAVIRGFGQAGIDPSIMGMGAARGAEKALKSAGWSVKDLDLVEANEAFAVQSICTNQELGWDPSIVNVNGGAIALGHPIGASGARILVTLLHEMQRRNAKKGLAALCIGGGMGVGMCVEKI
jgi:acetyl-CoA C-acetyltransferase